MGILNPDNHDSGDSVPLKATVFFARSVFMIANQQQAIRMFHIDRNLLITVAAQLVNTCLRDLSQLREIRGVRDILHTPSDSPAVIGTVRFQELIFGVKYFGKFFIFKGNLHKDQRNARTINPLG